MAQPCDMDLWVMKWRSAWPIFHGPVICLISWRLVEVCTSYFAIMNQYGPRFGLKINVGHCDLYFMVQWFCLVSRRLFDVSTSLLGIMNRYDPTVTYIFCTVSWRLFDLWTSYFGIMGQYDQTFDLKINIYHCDHCDLYFMVQWFCLISQRLHDGWVSYFQIMRQGDPNFDLKINIGQHDLYFMV